MSCIRGWCGLAWLGLFLIGTSALAAPDRAARVEAMTLYSQGMSVVADRRMLELDAGAQTVTWPLAGEPVAETLMLSGNGVRLTGFAMDDGEARDLAARIGEPVSLSDVAGGRLRRGTLVGMNGDTALVRVEGRIERITPAAPILIGWPAELGPGAESRLRLHLVADEGGRQPLELLYQRPAPSWRASYTARFDETSGQLALQAQAIIANDSETALSAGKAWLVAGDVQRAESDSPSVRMAAMQMTADAPGTAGPAEAVGGRYRYPLPNGMHVPVGATRGIALLPEQSLAAERITRFAHYALADTGETREQAMLLLKSRNTGEAPLPAGPVRVYDASATAQLLGGDRLSDTPVGAPIVLTLGEDFDVTGTHRVAAGEAERRRQVTITLFNASETSRRVSVREQLPDGARLVSAEPAPRDDSAPGEPAWQVPVASGGQTTVRYVLELPIRP